MQRRIFILCRDLNNLIGTEDNKLPWHIPSDLKRFKEITTNQILLFGKNTYESLPNRTLPNRTLLILTNDRNYKLSDEKNHFHVKIENNKIICDKIELKNKDIYICGGAKIYDFFIENENLKPHLIIESIVLKIHQVKNGIFISNNFNKICKNEYFIKKTTNNIDGVKTNLWIKKINLNQ